MRNDKKSKNTSKKEEKKKKKENLYLVWGLLPRLSGDDGGAVVAAISLSSSVTSPGRLEDPSPPKKTSEIKHIHVSKNETKRKMPFSTPS